jgi:hypothetical protein
VNGFGVFVGSLFTGKERDNESGNDYFEARYYGSSVGRFLRRVARVPGPAFTEKMGAPGPDFRTWESAHPRSPPRADNFPC